MRASRLIAGSLAVLCVACAATGNPSRAGLKPAPHQSEAKETTPAAQQPTEKPEEQAQAGSDAAQGLVATVAGRPVGVRDLLARMWLRDGDRAREHLDHLVVERLCELEAERLGLAIGNEAVEARLLKANEALEKRLRDAGSPLTVDEHVQKNLGLEPEFYQRQLRHEAIAQVVAERCVRAWSMEESRRVVRVLEVKDAATSKEVASRLSAGADFDTLAANFPDKDEKEPARIVLARAEASPLSRLAFATEVGRCAGPLEEQGRYIFLGVDAELPAVRGAWSEIGKTVEANLAETPVDEIEFMQWRSAMARRYEVDLSPFFTAIGSSRPPPKTGP